MNNGANNMNKLNRVETLSEEVGGVKGAIQLELYIVAGLDEDDCVWACGSPNPEEGSDLVCYHKGTCEGHWVDPSERPEEEVSLIEAKDEEREKRAEKAELKSLAGCPW